MEYFRIKINNRNKLSLKKKNITYLILHVGGGGGGGGDSPIHKYITIYPVLHSSRKGPQCVHCTVCKSGFLIAHDMETKMITKSIAKPLLTNL